MYTHVALLRAVNVGQNKVAMEELRGLFLDLGHADVTTYVQSGNIVFKSAIADAVQLRRDIEQQITTALGLKVSVLLRTSEQLAAVVAANPFVRHDRDIAWLHVTFLAEPPSPARLEALATRPVGADEFAVRGQEVYLCCPDGYGRTKLSNALFEKQLATVATTRNWKTVLKLLDMASA